MNALALIPSTFSHIRRRTVVSARARRLPSIIYAKLGVQRRGVELCQLGEGSAAVWELRARVWTTAAVERTLSAPLRIPCTQAPNSFHPMPLRHRTEIPASYSNDEDRQNEALLARSSIRSRRV